MNRVMLGIVGVILLVAAALYFTGNAGTSEAGPFEQSGSCAELSADFAAHPDARSLGDEYRARFRELGCEL